MDDPNAHSDWDKEYAAKFKSMAVWIDQHMATGVCPHTTGAETTADSAALLWRTLASMSEADTLDSLLPSKVLDEKLYTQVRTATYLPSSPPPFEPLLQSGLLF